jgi:hypothetical protein
MRRFHSDLRGRAAPGAAAADNRIGDRIDNPYNIVMAPAALKDLVLDDALTKPLPLPLSGSPSGPVSVADYAKALPDFEQLCRERVARAIASRTRLEANIENILSSSPELLADVLNHIDGLVEAVSKIIGNQKASLEAGRVETNRKIGNAASVDANAGGSLRKLQKRLKNPQEQNAAIEAIAKFMKSPRDQKLNFEPLVGRPGYFSIRVD